MSDILNLAQRFQQKLADQASATEQTLEQDFKKHEESIRRALKSSATTIENAIKDQNRQTLKYVLKTWLSCAIAVILLLSLAQAVIWAQGKRIYSNYQYQSELKANIAQLEQKGGRIQLSQCGDRICIPQAENSQTWQRDSDKRPMFIPEGY